MIVNWNCSCHSDDNELFQAGVGASKDEDGCYLQQTAISCETTPLRKIASFESQQESSLHDKLKACKAMDIMIEKK